MNLLPTSKLIILSFILLLSTLLATILQFIKGQLFQYAIQGQIDEVYIYIGLFFCFICLELSFYFIEWIYEAKITAKAMQRMKNKIIKRAIYASDLDIDSNVNILTNQINSLEYTYFYSLYNIIYLVFRVILVTIALVWINIYIGVIIILCMIIPLFVVKMTRQKLSNQNIILMKEREGLLKTIQLEFANRVMTNIFGIQEARLQKIKARTLAERNAWHQLTIFTSKANIVNSTLSYGTHFVVFMFAAILVAKGQLASGMVITLLGLVEQLSMPLVSITRQLNNMNSTIGIREELIQMMACAHSAPKLNVASTISLHDVRIQFEEFEKSYPNMQIEKGKKYLILGKSGVGKSVLLQSIVGIISSYTGEIRYDNQTARQVNLWENVAYIDANLQLYTDSSLIYNLVFAEKLSKNDVNIIDDMLKDITEDTTILELSTGQKRRILSLRGLLSSKEFLFFDEPTSNLDPENKIKLIEKILTSSKTIIMISHDIPQEYYELFDNIYRL